MECWKHLADEWGWVKWELVGKWTWKSESNCRGNIANLTVRKELHTHDNRTTVRRSLDYLVNSIPQGWGRICAALQYNDTQSGALVICCWQSFQEHWDSISRIILERYTVQGRGSEITLEIRWKCRNSYSEESPREREYKIDINRSSQ